MAVKPLERLTPAERNKRIAQLVQHPGTRSTIPTKYLPQSYRQMREMNARLRAPIVAGSTITNRDLSHQADAAATQKYGLADTQAKQAVTDSQKREGDVSGWYDSYLKELQQHTASTQAAGATAAQQIQNLGNVQGPAGSTPQDPGNQEIAQQAAAVRQALLGAMQGALSEQGRAATTYADTLGRVVGPGQKLGAQTTAAANTTKARDMLGELAREKGAYKDTFRAGAIADESKNVLSRQALGLDTLKAKADITDSASQLNKYGFTTSEWAKLPERTRTAYRTGANKPKTAPTTGYGPGRPGLNKYGYTADQWDQLNPADQATARTGKGPKAPSASSQYATDFYNKYGVQPASTDAIGKAKNTVQTASSFVEELKDAGWTRAKAGQQLLQGGQVPIGSKPKLDSKGQPIAGPDGKTVTVPTYKTYPKQPAIWLTVALDLAYLNGRISAGTADRLHKMGYSVKQLGLTTPPPRTISRPANADDGNGQMRPT